MTPRMLVRLFVVLGLTGLIHYYLWARLVRDVGLPAPWYTVGTVVAVALCLCVPAALVLSRSEIGSWRKLVLFPAYIWMGAMLMLLMGLIVLDVVRAGGTALHHIASIASLSSTASSSDAGGHLTMARFGAGMLALATGGATLYGIRSALGEVRVKDVDVRLARLPPSMDGTVIVQLSDVHVGATIRRPFVEEIVAKTNALAPDVVVITGDLVDGSVRELREHVAPLENLRARYGVFFVTGNHEYYSGARSWCAELGRLGIRVLRNERVAIGEGEGGFDLAGVDDYSSRGFGHGHGADLQKAVRGRDTSRELVLLAHQPKEIHRAREHGVGLQLSGHTHGGQIWPWNYLVRLQQPVVAGLHRWGDTQLYVSSGTGFWGPPIRTAAPAEISRIVLRSAAHTDVTKAA